MLPAYRHAEGEIPAGLAPGTLLSLKRATPLKIYGLGFQPARTIPEIPRWFARHYLAPPCAVLDPFAGAGTSIIEGLRAGAAVGWLDYHPLSRLICRVKTTPTEPEHLRAAAGALLQQAAQCRHAPQTVRFARKDFWFQPPVQEALELLRAGIAAADAAVQPALWLAFAATVRKTSNMNDGMLLAARRAHVAAIPQRSRADVWHAFRTYAERAAAALAEWQPLLRGAGAAAHELPLDDARALAGAGPYDAIVTSPPYINAIDYVWAAKFELHWLGLVPDDAARLALSAREIGTERIPHAAYNELGRTGHAQLDALIEEMYHGTRYRATRRQNRLRARVVYQYFCDMRQHFASAVACLRPGGYYCLTVGDTSRICGVTVPVAALLSEMAQAAGLCERFRFHLLLKQRRLNLPRNVAWAGTIKHDTVLVLQRPT